MKIVFLFLSFGFCAAQQVSLTSLLERSGREFAEIDEIVSFTCTVPIGQILVWTIDPVVTDINPILFSASSNVQGDCFVQGGVTAILTEFHRLPDMPGGVAVGSFTSELIFQNFGNVSSAIAMCRNEDLQTADTRPYMLRNSTDAPPTDAPLTDAPPLNSSLPNTNTSDPKVIDLLRHHVDSAGNMDGSEYILEGFAVRMMWTPPPNADNCMYMVEINSTGPNGENYSVLVRESEAFASLSANFYIVTVTVVDQFNQSMLGPPVSMPMDLQAMTNTSLVATTVLVVILVVVAALSIIAAVLVCVACAIKNRDMPSNLRKKGNVMPSVEVDVRIDSLKEDLKRTEVERDTLKVDLHRSAAERHNLKEDLEKSQAEKETLKVDLWRIAAELANYRKEKETAEGYSHQGGGVLSALGKAV